MEKPDYTWYADVFGGCMTEAEFGAFAPSAAVRVREILTRDTATDAEDSAVKEAVCVAAEIMRDAGSTMGGSFRIGNFSASVDAKNTDAAAGAAAARILAPMGLCFRGLA